MMAPSHRRACPPNKSPVGALSHGPYYHGYTTYRFLPRLACGLSACRVEGMSDAWKVCLRRSAGPAEFKRTRCFVA